MFWPIVTYLPMAIVRAQRTWRTNTFAAANGGDAAFC